jgi:kynureninase
MPDGALYMDGNSLGRQPKETGEVVTQVLAHWRDEMIIAWREWIRVPRRVGDAIAQFVVEANPGEVIVGDSTSVNLYKAAAAAVTAQAGRRTLLTSDDNFPTDMYALQSLAAQHSLQLKVLHADPVEGLDIDVLRDALNADVGLLALSHVAYRSGALLDMTRVTQLAHHCGALVLWDVSHSAGSVRVPLESSGADLAVGCTYKYLNGGPGAPSFVYVRASQQQRLRQPLWGWFGHRDQFAMSDAFEPADGIDAFLVGIPAILSTAAIEPGVRCIAEAGRRAPPGQGTAPHQSDRRPGRRLAGTARVQRCVAARGGATRLARDPEAPAGERLRARLDPAERDSGLPAARHDPLRTGAPLHRLRRRMGRHAAPARPRRHDRLVD